MQFGLCSRPPAARYTRATPRQGASPWRAGRERCGRWPGLPCAASDSLRSVQPPRLRPSRRSPATERCPGVEPAALRRSLPCAHAARACLSAPAGTLARCAHHASAAPGRCEPRHPRQCRTPPACPSGRAPVAWRESGLPALGAQRARSMGAPSACPVRGGARMPGSACLGPDLAEASPSLMECIARGAAMSHVERVGSDPRRASARG